MGFDYSRALPLQLFVHLLTVSMGHDMMQLIE
jgi:hypothetical protein